MEISYIQSYMFFSVIVPVYNRPGEIKELLESLTHQTYTHFEVIIVEDGSGLPCREQVEEFKNKLNIHYYCKENSGQGFSRNYGFQRAKGDFLVVFDSDCIIPPHYFETVCRSLVRDPVDAWGGPDRSHPDFTPLQKAISYAMTSPITTGGIRGRKNHIGTFHPRSFNMGISREVYEKTGGYRLTRMGEDLEFSIRIIRNGFRTALIEEAYVYHKRRTNFREFFRQLHFFGRARVNIRRFYPDEVKPIHLMPAVFLMGLVLLAVMPLLSPSLFLVLLTPYLLFTLLLLVHAYSREHNLYVSILAVLASCIQLAAYGAGFLQELFRGKRNIPED